MSVTLATAWNPHGELGRFQRQYDVLLEVYTELVVTLPPDVDSSLLAALECLRNVRPVVTPEWPWGRYLALKTSLDGATGHVHYADFDRLLRWVETRPDEWRRTVDTLMTMDCVVIGRTAAAWETHPQALQQTEAISNTVFSHLLGQALDLSAGSKGFSRAAVDFLIANTTPGRAMGADSEWVVLLHRAGFQVDTLLVDGLDWETADRHQDRAAGTAQQREAAAQYDLDPQQWAMRVAVADEIVAAGLEAVARPLLETKRID